MAEYIERTRALDIAMGTPAYYFLKIEPTADVVEVRHGEWVDDCGKRVPFDEKDGCPKYSCYCSECGKWLTASDEYPCYGNYCPNCGAKMDGKGEC